MDHKQCRHMLGSLSDFIDGTLEEEICAKIESHLAECPDCSIVVDTLQKTIYLYRTTSETESLPEGVRDRLFASLNLEGNLEQNDRT